MSLKALRDAFDQCNSADEIRIDKGKQIFEACSRITALTCKVDLSSSKGQRSIFGFSTILE